MQFNKLVHHLQSLHPVNIWPGSSSVFETDLRGLSASTKDIHPQFVFVAIPGTTVNGENFIPEAIQKGAVVIVASDHAYEKYSDQFPHVAFITTSNAALCLAKMASLFYPQAPAHIVAVTGTNGKSSTVEFARQIWDYLGLKSASLGTLGIQSQWFKAEKHLTTPDPVYLHRQMGALAKAGITHLALEASSHGLSQHRLDGLRLKAGGFTSFSRDHLDYHGTMENYLQAKGRLFSHLVRSSQGIAVLNADIPEYQPLVHLSQGLKVISYGRQGHDFHINKITPLPHGQRVDLSVFGTSYTLNLHLMGEFQVYNALCALGLVLSDSSIPIEKAVRALETLRPPAGRLEFIANTPKGAAVYVDYAHAEDAIKTVLQALRKHTQKDLWIVFGAGGGRDPGTRPPMGQAAAQNADHVILTDDNPRFENPAAIRAKLKEGAPQAHEIPDRRQAIAHAIHHAQKDDIILVAGKGPEDGQIVQGVTEPFLDSRVILETIQQAGHHEK
ncbi:MAG: UDP-N-acetylmuramoyl-L-alanyl-D-glutamate--2,6-diaminopimelate ligase [Alphaproteobacteria bacterium]